MGKSTMDILVKSISCLPFILTVSGVFGSNPCDPGLYGELCDKRCSVKCRSHSDNNIYCEKHYGTCSLGCVPGWYNENCIIPCSQNCIGDVCNQQTGQCTKGCKGNYRGAMCDVHEVTRNDPPTRNQDQRVRDVIIIVSIGLGVMLLSLVYAGMRIICCTNSGGSNANCPGADEGETTDLMEIRNHLTSNPIHTLASTI